MYLAQGIENLVEEQQYFSFCDLCNVVHALTRIISDSGILILEAG